MIAKSVIIHQVDHTFPYLCLLSLSLTCKNNLCHSTTHSALLTLLTYHPVLIGSYPVTPTVYVPDSVPPTLLRWYIDRIALSAHLYFSEPGKVIMYHNVFDLKVLYSILPFHNILVLYLFC